MNALREVEVLSVVFINLMAAGLGNTAVCQAVKAKLMTAISEL